MIIHVLDRPKRCDLFQNIQNIGMLVIKEWMESIRDSHLFPGKLHKLHKCSLLFDELCKKTK